MIIILTFIAFTGLVALISWYKTKEENLSTKEGYFLAGRGLTGLVIAGSLEMTNLSTEQLVGQAGQSYSTNMGAMSWSVNASIALLALALIFLPKYLKAGITTIPEFLEVRFDRTTKQIISFLFLLGYMLTYLPTVLYSGALAFNQIFHLDQLLGITTYQSIAILCVAIGVIGSIYAIFGGNLVEMSQFAFKIDNIMCEMVLNPDRVHTFLDRLMEMHRVNLKKFVDAVGDYVDVIGFGDDMGTQNGPQFSPDMYREFFQPRHKELWSAVRRYNPNLRTNLHCCGSIDRLLPDIIAAGINSINPVQINCSGMSPEHLKEAYGKDIAFWGGGCDSNVCMSASPQQVAEHVEKNVRIFYEGSGFIFQHVHNILANVPPQNIITMFGTVRSFGK